MIHCDGSDVVEGARMLAKEVSGRSSWFSVMESLGELVIPDGMMESPWSGARCFLILSENNAVFKPGLYFVDRELADGINMMYVYSCSASQAEYVDPLDFSKSIPPLRKLITE